MCVMGKLSYALVPAFDPQEFEATVKEDWQRDSGGKGQLDREALHASLFELADMWCDVVR